MGMSTDTPQRPATVPPGYQQTEVGVIPDDWEVRTVSDIAAVRTGPFGSSLHERDYVEEGTPIVTVQGNRI
jgi:type I restriction enzyme S subunit